MTDTLDRETLADLARPRTWPAISIHMPTHRTGPGVQQDPIRFKNLVRTAEESLRNAGMRLPDVDALLQPAHDLLGDTAFWRESTDGLAVFLSEDFSRIFRLDIELPERITIGKRFLIRPVLPSLDTGERFFVLAFSKKCVRLLEGTRTEVRELDLAGVPTSLADALKYDDYERQVQFHSGTPAGGGTGRRPAMFHGHGGIPDVEKTNLSRYFRMIDRGLHEFLRDDCAPLLLAGVDYLIPIYRQVNSYPHLVDVSMTGNPDEVSAAELHAEARGLLKPYLRAELERNLACFRELEGTDLVSDDLAKIVPAAHEGRVKVLFVSQAPAMYGSFDPTSARLHISVEPQPDDWDLADLAVAESLLHRGTVHAVEAIDADKATVTAAIFRY